MEETEQSILGIVSTVLAVLAGLGLAGLFVIATIMGMQNQGQVDEGSPAVMMLGFGILGMPVLHLISLGLGVGALFQPNRSKIFPIIGIALSLVGILFVVGLLALGMMMKARGG